MSMHQAGSRAVTIVTTALLLAAAGQALGQDEIAPQGRAVQAGAVIGAVSPTALYLRAGTIDLAGASAPLETLAGREGRFVIQLDGPMTPQRRAALENAGVRLGDYLPTNSFVVRLDAADAGRLARLGFVRWAGAFQSAWKVAPDVGVREMQTNDRLLLQGLGMSALMIDLFSDADVAATIDAIHAISDRSEVVHVSSIGEQAVLHVLAPAALAAQIAELDGVQFIEDAPELTMRNNTTRWIIQTNVSGSTTLYDNGLHGEGQVLGHMDGRININHCSFKDAEGDSPGPNHRKIVAYNAPFGSEFHGTHTAGTAAGDNGVMNDTRGMAYLAKIAFDDIPNFTEAAFYNSLVQHEGQGARVHTNSWGNDGTTQYDGMCRAIDRFCYDYEDNLVAFAVTNQFSLKNPENAKNVLAVGATNDNPNQNGHCSGGQGPTSDNRRKPEIYAPGCGTQSSYSATSCSTTSATGTSMACPAIAGVGLLVRQYFTDGYYPSGSLIKAALINGSVDMTGVSGYPSNREGWGRLIADYALYFPGDLRTMWAEDVRNASGLSTGQSVEYPIEVGGAGEQLRVTMAFTDAPASAGASFAAINDLDLEVEAPDGTIYKGNAFSGGVSVPGGTKDDRNNLEQVHVSSPAVGTWTVRVVGAAVNVGAQGYALVATGELVGANACVADFNGDGTVDTQDVLSFLNAWNADDGSADVNGDGTINTQDVLSFLNLWNAGC
ncbi:MAG TPA: S8 family serine peptidase [Phycisphaerales bacterium]|nr:S8 family serine peptidase [Phycisphaerales bacterium]